MLHRNKKKRRTTKMTIDEIRKQWTNTSTKDIEASVEMWDNISENFNAKPVPDWETDRLLKLLNKWIPFTKDMTALDVGCGTGVYSIALAEKIKHAVGIDLSPKMIEFANEKARVHGTENTEFICSDWAALDIEKEGFKGHFDLAFANMTPSVFSAETFEKLNACSKKYCLMAQGTRRKSTLSDHLRTLIGLKEKYTSIDDSVSYAFQLLWAQGYSPKIEYHDDVWERENTLEEAYSWYIPRLRTYKTLTEEDEATVKEYLQSRLVDGKIKETVTTTIVTMYWEK